MSDRVEYIRRRLDQLEAAARAIHRDGCTWVVQRQYYPCDCGVPAAVLARVAADRAMLADLLAEPHFLDESEWYGCQAVTRDGQPTGDECTCGRDERVARRVRLMAEGLGWTGGSSE